MGVAAPSLQSGAAGAAGVLGFHSIDLSAGQDERTYGGGRLLSGRVEFRSVPGSTRLQFCSAAGAVAAPERGPRGQSTHRRARPPVATLPPSLGCWRRRLVRCIGWDADVESGAGRDGGFNPLAMLFDGARGGAAGGAGRTAWRESSVTLRARNWGSFKRSPSNPTYGTDETATTSNRRFRRQDHRSRWRGWAAMLAGGTMLAQQGLLGNSRGTWTGTAEGTAGGAAIGFQMGGPLGALIGGAAGFGIGIGEMIAGVKSPQRERTTTSRASTVSIFPEQRHDQAGGPDRPSQFGGQIAVAVRSRASVNS